MIIPHWESVVETKSCKSCGTDFAITDKDLEFYDKVSPVFNGKKENIPTPTLCPDCRQRRRLAFRNERKLYKRKCDLTGKDIVSMYAPIQVRPVYATDDWWMALAEGSVIAHEFDPHWSFFDQLQRLAATMPLASLVASRWLNPGYCNYLLDSTDCYSLFVCSDSESCFFGRNVRRSKDCVDCTQIAECENCYSLTIWAGNYGVSFSYHVFRCRDCAFLSFCEDCSDCFGCVNLTNRQYCVLNQQLSKEEYAAFRQEIDSGGLPAFQEKFLALLSRSPRPAYHQLNSEAVYYSDFVRDSESVTGSRNIADCHNVRFCSEIEGSHDCMDCDMWVWRWNGLCLDSLAIAKGNHAVVASYAMIDCTFAFYSQNCYSCQHVFGCVNLINKQYCILNKQYTRDEYFVLVPRIIEHMRKTGEWGEFFSPSISPFGYNETVAMEYYPLTKEQAIAQWFNWSDYEPPFPKVDKIIPASKLPEKIEDIPDDILNWAIECEITKKPYRIIKQELEFYRKHHLPIPRRHPDQRHLDRLALRNPRKLYERPCDKCQKPMVTTYSSDRPERVYCEECYRKEVYG